MVGFDMPDVLNPSYLVVELGLGIGVLVPLFPGGISLDTSKTEGSKDCNIVFALPGRSLLSVKEVITNLFNVEHIPVC